MNPFERIKEMKEILKAEIKNNGIKSNDTITQMEHYKRMVNMLNVLEKEMEDAEYHYQVESIDRTVTTFDDFTVFQQQLNDDVLIFQPMTLSEDDLSIIDMQSLADTLRHLHENGQIKENILLLPPNINILKAKLALSSTDSDE